MEYFTLTPTLLNKNYLKNLLIPFKWKKNAHSWFFCLSHFYLDIQDLHSTEQKQYTAPDSSFLYKEELDENWNSASKLLRN